MKKFFRKINTKYCLMVFVLASIIWYFLVHKTLFVWYYTILGIIFILTFALTLTCMTRNTKEKIVAAKQYKKSLIGIIWVVIWISALQVCWVNALFCGSTIWFGILSVILPVSFLNFMSEYSIYIIIASILTQFIWIYYMKCFR